MVISLNVRHWIRPDARLTAALRAAVAKKNPALFVAMKVGREYMASAGQIAHSGLKGVYC